MYLHLYEKSLCTKGRSFIKKNFVENLESFFSPYQLNIYQKFILFLSNKSKYKDSKNLNSIFKEFQNYQKNIILKQNYYIDLLTNGNINQFKEDVQKEVAVHDFVTYHLDQIIDEFNIDVLNGEAQIKLENIIELILYSHFKELVFYCLLDDVKIEEKEKGVLEIIPSIKLENEFKKRWLSMVWESESKNFFAMELLKICMTVKFDKSIKVKFIEHISGILMDKVFYLNPSYIDKIYLIKKEIQIMKKICSFFAFILINFYLGKNTNKNDDIFFQLNIDEKFIDTLLEINDSYKSINKGFILINNQFKWIDGSDFYYIIKNYFLDKINKNKNNFGNYIGKAFESYIFNYINTSNKYQNYAIFKTDIKEKEDKKKLDIDLILYDKSNKKYFFIQVKHSVYAKAYLSEEILHFCDNKTLMRKAFTQLENFNYFYNKDNNLKDKIINCGIKENDLENKNFEYMVIHTIPPFDFNKHNNILLYDWNTFRNILNKAFRNHTHTNLHKSNFSTQSKINLDISNPLKVIEYFLETTKKDDTTSFKDIWEESKNIMYSIPGKKYIITSTIK